MITGSADDVFIVWAYVGVAAATLGLIGWVWWESRRVRTRLADLEARGVRRRSAGAAR